MNAPELYPTCGEYAGVSMHNREKTPKCDACKKAARQYKRRLRTDDEYRAAEYEKTAARSRALWKLANKHLDEFHELFKAEMASMKLRP